MFARAVKAVADKQGGGDAAPAEVAAEAPAEVVADAAGEAPAEA
jgi:hypothetical protein